MYKLKLPKSFEVFRITQSLNSESATQSSSSLSELTEIDQSKNSFDLGEAIGKCK